MILIGLQQKFLQKHLKLEKYEYFTDEDTVPSDENIID